MGMVCAFGDVLISRRGNNLWKFSFEELKEFLELMEFFFFKDEKLEYCLEVFYWYFIGMWCIE